MLYPGKEKRVPKATSIADWPAEAAGRDEADLSTQAAMDDPTLIAFSGSLLNYTHVSLSVFFDFAVTTYLSDTYSAAVRNRDKKFTRFALAAAQTRVWKVDGDHFPDTQGGV